MIILAPLVRVSLGTAMALGLIEGLREVASSTAYLMTYSESKCDENCAFCPQARSSTSSADRLSRISWPTWDLDEVVARLGESKSTRRVCLQCLNYVGMVDDAATVIERVRESFTGPLSICTPPLGEADLKRVRAAGATDIGIAIDAATPEVFDSVKGAARNSSYTWELHHDALRRALTVFDRGHVTTHVIVGLGERESDVARFIFTMLEAGIRVSLFAFTGVRGTDMHDAKPPDLGAYRRLQIVLYLASRRLLTPDKVNEDRNGHLTLAVESSWLQQVLSSGAAFRTAGCPGCDRPYYNERPRGPMYNYPRPLTPEETAAAIADSGLVRSNG
ncbi:MAG: radical SAM protein [Candidatus Thorarchaeota archaeon]|nr:radical SAM protein [Candidatus Thorarchaeota archaeon]